MWLLVPERAGASVRRNATKASVPHRCDRRTVCRAHDNLRPRGGSSLALPASRSAIDPLDVGRGRSYERRSTTSWRRNKAGAGRHVARPVGSATTPSTRSAAASRIAEQSGGGVDETDASTCCDRIGVAPAPAPAPAPGSRAYPVRAAPDLVRLRLLRPSLSPPVCPACPDSTNGPSDARLWLQRLTSFVRSRVQGPEHRSGPVCFELWRSDLLSFRHTHWDAFVPAFVWFLLWLPEDIVTRHPHGATARQGHGAGWKHEQPRFLMPRIGRWRRAPGGARQGADVAGGPIEKRPDVGPTIASAPEPQAEASRRRRSA